MVLYAGWPGERFLASSLSSGPFSLRPNAISAGMKLVLSCQAVLIAKQNSGIHQSQCLWLFLTTAEIINFSVRLVPAFSLYFWPVFNLKHPPKHLHPPQLTTEWVTMSTLEKSLSFINPNGSRRNSYCWFFVMNAILGMLLSLMSTCQYSLCRYIVLKTVAPCKVFKISCIWGMGNLPSCVFLIQCTEINAESGSPYPFSWPSWQERPLVTLMVVLCLVLTSFCGA